MYKLPFQLLLLISSISAQLLNLSPYEYPTPSNDTSSGLERIAILSTSDIHGYVSPVETYNSVLDRNIKMGGLSLMSPYLQTLKEEWGNNLLWLDAGDLYQGTLETNLHHGETTVEAVNYLTKKFNVTMAAGVGNHEFDFNIENLKKNVGRANFSFISANIYNKTSQRFWNETGIVSSKIFELGGVKVGVLGLTTNETFYTSTLKIVDLEFRDYLNTTLSESQKLREQGADVVLLIAHIGMSCYDKNDLFTLKLRDNTTQNSSACSLSVLHDLISNLPENTVDAVFAGHSHTVVHHWIKNTPVIISFSYARHINVVYLTVNKTRKSVVKEKTIIEGPIPICEKLMKSKMTCNPESIDIATLIKEKNIFHEFEFHKKMMKEDLGLYTHLEKYLKGIAGFKSDVLAFISHQMEITKYYESTLGNFIADAVKNYTNADVVILNPGMVRRNWPNGNLTNYILHQTITFDNTIIIFEILGSELKNLLKIIQEGEFGYYITAGIRTTMCISPKFLADIKFVNGIQIIDNLVYKVAATDFLVQGGDDFYVAIKKVNIVNPQKSEQIRKVIEIYLRKIKVVDAKRLKSKRYPRLVLRKQCIMSPYFEQMTFIN